MIEPLSAQRISIMGEPEQELILQRSTNLPPVWENVGMMLEEKGGLFTYINVAPMITRQMFFRVITNYVPVSVKLSATSPVERLVQISTENPTPDVVLGIFDVTSTTNGTLRKIYFYIWEETAGKPTEIFSRIQLEVEGVRYTANSITLLEGEKNAVQVMFTDLSIQQLANISRSYRLIGEVRADITNNIEGSLIRASLPAYSSEDNFDSNPAIEDAAYNLLRVKKAYLTASRIVLSSAGAYVENPWVQLGEPTETPDGPIYPTQFNFLVVASENTVFVSYTNAVSIMVGPQTIFGPANLTTTPAEIAGDAPGHYFTIPAGTSRTIQISGAMRKVGAGIGRVSLSSFNYGFSGTDVSLHHITLDLSKFTLEAQF